MTSKNVNETKKTQAAAQGDTPKKEEAYFADLFKPKRSRYYIASGYGATRFYR